MILISQSIFDKFEYITLKIKKEEMFKVLFVVVDIVFLFLQVIIASKIRTIKLTTVRMNRMFTIIIICIREKG